MGAGGHSYRVGVGVHAFEAGGELCLCAAYLEEARQGSRYRYAVLCGGEAAVRALRTAPLDPGDSDEPGPHRRVSLATYVECEEFLERLPTRLVSGRRSLRARCAETAARESAAVPTARDVSVSQTERKRSFESSSRGPRRP
jgi:hypothetical protein